METFNAVYSEAINLLLYMDSEVFAIVGLSIFVSLTATVLAAVISIPLGLWIGLKQFPGRSLVKLFLSTALGIPPVVLGLIVVLLLSRRGPLGQFELLFTTQAMLIAQFLLVSPIVAVGAMEASATKGKPVYELMCTLGLKPMERIGRLVWELRSSVALSVLTAFGRAISEVGAVMLVGGNIKDHTRVMTTYIATQNSMGNFSASIAMAIVLLAVALLVNTLVHSLAGGVHGDTD